MNTFLYHHERQAHDLRLLEAYRTDPRPTCAIENCPIHVKHMGDRCWNCTQEENAAIEREQERLDTEHDGDTYDRVAVVILKLLIVGAVAVAILFAGGAAALITQ